MCPHSLPTIGTFHTIPDWILGHSQDCLQTIRRHSWYCLRNQWIEHFSCVWWVVRRNGIIPFGNASWSYLCSSGRQVFTRVAGGILNGCPLKILHGPRVCSITGKAEGYTCNVPSGLLKSRPSVSPEIIYPMNIPNIESHLSSGSQVLHQYYGSGVCYF